ncbi:MAG TPA: hypothetical protein VLZ83_02670 [Edaphocola sp.]|nr:hypothetical protein [Edaphocola sp.]
MSKKRFKYLGRFTFEFIIIFISVILAFSLSNWKQNKDEQISQRKILFEIGNGLNIDKKDFEANIESYNTSFHSIKTFRNWINGTEISPDSIGLYYLVLFRSFSPIINKTGYESLKNTNLKTIKNDSLRTQIIELYEYHYKIIELLENEAEEFQDFKNYFKRFNSILLQYMVFDDKGNLTELLPARNIEKEKKNEILSYLWRMELERNFKLFRYDGVLEHLNLVKTSIEKELENDR